MPEQPVQPGLVIKAVLTGQIDLDDLRGNVGVVSEAAVTDLHRTYKSLIAFENETRDAEGRKNKLKAMTYPSFASLVNKARRLGFIEAVREDPLETARGRGVLKSVRNIGNDSTPEYIVVDATRIIYKLTREGLAADREWRDLTGAFTTAYP